jgi:hypothetical protein
MQAIERPIIPHFPPMHVKKPIKYAFPHKIVLKEISKLCKESYAHSLRGGESELGNLKP